MLKASAEGMYSGFRSDDEKIYISFAIENLQRLSSDGYRQLKTANDTILEKECV